MDAAEISEDIWHLIKSDELLMADIRSWWQWRNKESFELDPAFTALFGKYPEFRSLVDFRFRSAGHRQRVCNKMRRANDLYFGNMEVGPGFRIQHGHSTWVMAAKIGENFHINQNVTVGVSKGGMPNIGNNVRILTGAVVIGAVTIGDGVVIAPNAFVNFDVPAGKKVFPARSVIV
ncbi:MAG: hypothetical protein NVV72_12190 [Asticcacaulis sp.]|nr:hypothetical protein [Asticcacaulis sp.]